MSQTNSAQGNDINLVEIWLRRDPVRWVAGICAGILAGAIALAFGVVLSSLFGADPCYVARIPAIPFLGPEALEYANIKAVWVGVIVFELFGAFLGMIYAHFTGTNSIPALFGVGVTWGIFGWIFISNLYTPAWRIVFAAQIPSGAAIFFWLVFGISLTSVAFFDRTLRGSGNK